MIIILQEIIRHYFFCMSEKKPPVVKKKNRPSPWRICAMERQVKKKSKKRVNIWFLSKENKIDRGERKMST
jgi:hypothetical protein